MTQEIQTKRFEPQDELFDGHFRQRFNHKVQQQLEELGINAGSPFPTLEGLAVALTASCAPPPPPSPADSRTPGGATGNDGSSAMSSPPPKGKSTPAASDIGSVAGQRPASFSAGSSSSIAAGRLQASPPAKRIAAGLITSSGLLGMALKAAQSECPSSVGSAEAAADGSVVIPKAGCLRHLTPHQKCKYWQQKAELAKFMERTIDLRLCRQGWGHYEEVKDTDGTTLKPHRDWLFQHLTTAAHCERLSPEGLPEITDADFKAAIEHLTDPGVGVAITPSARLRMLNRHLAKLKQQGPLTAEVFQLVALFAPEDGMAEAGALFDPFSPRLSAIPMGGSAKHGCFVTFATYGFFELWLKSFPARPLHLWGRC